MMQQYKVQAPVDGLVAIIVLAAFISGFKGTPLSSAVLVLLTLTVYLVYLSKAQKPLLLYKPQFAHWYLILAASVLLIVIGQKLRYLPIITTGIVFYHYVCICIVERKFRYAPRGFGYSFKTVRDTESPTLFWTCIVLLSLVSIGMLIAPFVIWMLPE